MTLSRWNSYLSNNNNPLHTLKQGSDIGNIIDYFSAPNLLDTFYLGGDFDYNNTQFNFFTNNVVLINEGSLYNIQSIDNNFSNINFLDYRNLLTDLPVQGLDSYIRDIKLITPSNSNLDSLIDFFPERVIHFENFELSNLEFDEGVFEALSTPDSKLFYPEPFVASPSFVHEDMWWLHIMHFQHWLWFFFISLIMFFFITFINTVRWCNIRNKPKRETRGVSRSKCADLITAWVPVSWATAIIITETVDATDYYDGFGTGEIVVGIRAYQWGWEYFYPKSVDLNYNVNPSYSTIMGKSLKYFNTSSNSIKSNTLWKFHQNKHNNVTSTPAHVILSPNDNSNLLNFMNLDDIGVSTVKDSTAFKKVQFFSKIDHTSLFNVKSDFQNSFNKLSNLYNNDLDLNSSFTYGMDRQHNFSSLNSTLPFFTTLLDNTSLSKFFNYNFNNINNCGGSKNNLSLNRVTYDTLGSDSKNLNMALPQYFNLIPRDFNRFHSLDFFVFLKIPNIFSVLSNESDSKQFSNTFKSVLNFKHKRKSLWNLEFILNDYSLGGTESTINPFSNFSSQLFNTEHLLKFKDLKSSNAQFLGSERTVRLLNNVNSNSFKWNIAPTSNNVTSVFNTISTFGGNQNNIYSSSAYNWLDHDKHVKFSNNAISMPTSHSPIMSVNPLFSNTSFDFFEKGADEVTPMVLRSKEESAPSHVFNTYWSSYWSLSSVLNRLSFIDNSSNFLKSFYFPFFTEYAEYDFRNWASIELMEDSFWESPYNSSLHDEYFSVKQNLNNSDTSTKQETLFNSTLRSVKDTKLRSGVLTKPFLKDVSSNLVNISSLPIFSEEPIMDTSSLLPKDFNLFPNELTIDASEEGYESAKYLNYLYYLNYKNILNGFFSNTQPVAYTHIFDSFRSDYEDPFLYSDEFYSSSLDSFSQQTTSNYTNPVRLSNPFKIRSTVKNSIVTYGAIQKVFRSRFDEGRSNARLEDFSNSYVKHPFITDNRTSYESLLGKNKESFMKVNFYNHTSKLTYSNMSPLFYSNNIYFMDLPFLVSMLSDPSRYLWFDWQSKWSSMELAASSVSRYSLLGLPYSNKSFEYSTGIGDDLNDSETYLIKLSKARKVYNSSWALTPYAFSRITNWYNTNYIVDSISTGQLNSVFSARIFLKNSNLYWNSVNLSQHKPLFTPTYSNINSPSRFSWKPFSGPSFFFYSEGVLSDILSKREYLYRHLFNSMGFKTNLPDYFIASPRNPLMLELKNLPNYIDPIKISSESSRDLLYSNASTLNLNTLYYLFSGLNYLNLPLNLNFFYNSVLFYFTANPNNSNVNNVNDLYRDQYRPMKKGISNMIKFHTTGAVAMPIETRMHLLASSKDVIHSWAIPSAGIKIDCVPGYSSHRVIIFLVSGIFWGQCMEICGRFHHWMPIVVFFIKRDLFFLWCTHFMHFSATDNTFTSADRQFCDYVKPVSFSHSSWVTDINNSL